MANSRASRDARVNCKVDVSVRARVRVRVRGVRVGLRHEWE